MRTLHRYNKVGSDEYGIPTIGASTAFGVTWMSSKVWILLAVVVFGTVGILAGSGVFSSDPEPDVSTPQTGSNTSIVVASVTGTPTLEPTTGSPTTVAPTGSPTTVAPTVYGQTYEPTTYPTTYPTDAPTTYPTGSPTTAAPTDAPTGSPTVPPTTYPTGTPTDSPTTAPPTDLFHVLYLEHDVKYCTPINGINTKISVQADCLAAVEQYAGGEGYTLSSPTLDVGSWSSRPKLCSIEVVSSSVITARFNTRTGAVYPDNWDQLVHVSLCNHALQPSHPYYVISDNDEEGNADCDETTQLCPQSECLEPEHHVQTAEECLIAAKQLLSGYIEYGGNDNYLANVKQIYCIGHYDDNTELWGHNGVNGEYDLDQYGGDAGTPCPTEKCSYQGTNCYTNSYSEKYDGIASNDDSNGGGSVRGVYIHSATNTNNDNYGFGCNFQYGSTKGWFLSFNSNEDDKSIMVSSDAYLVCNHDNV